METFSNYLKVIAYLLAVLMLSPSCLVYKKSASIDEHANSEKNTLLKIFTADGKKYKVRWIEELDGYVYSIAKTKRVPLKRKVKNRKTQS